MDTLKQLIQQLQNPGIYDHPTDSFSVMETHISFVILTGQYAYKIKKPLDLGFLDFSTLEKRRFFCEEEIRLNRLITPDIYLAVIPIQGTHDHPIINNGTDPVIEYAVKMHQFPQTALFNHRLHHQQLSLDLIRQTASVIAHVHLQANRGLSDNPYGTYEQIHEPVVQNFSQIQPLLTDQSDQKLLEKLLNWSEKEHTRLFSMFNARKEQGYIRECHGDIHLGNIALIDGKPVLFDCIEFNDSFRWTDVMADIGFLMMDLEEKGEFVYAHQLLSTYVEETQDYSGLNVLDYYKAYRAIVRAKIALFQSMQMETSLEKKACWQQYRRCMELADRYGQQHKPVLWITHGLTATGKTTVAEYLVAQAGFIHLSSDKVRKQLNNVPSTVQSDTPLFKGIYTREMTDNVYTHLQEIARTVLEAGYSVIIDATFIYKAHRESIRALALFLGVSFKILNIQTNQAKTLEWLAHRQTQPNQISEAREDIYWALKIEQEALDESELIDTISLDVSDSKHMEQTLHQCLSEKTNS